MKSNGEFEPMDIVMLADTGDEFNGRAARVVERIMGLTKVKIVIPATGEIVERVYTDQALHFVDEADGSFLVEKCCSVCHRLNWDNHAGSYNERHYVEETGRYILCDDKGRTYSEGDLVPPAV